MRRVSRRRFRVASSPALPYDRNVSPGARVVCASRLDTADMDSLLAISRTQEHCHRMAQSVNKTMCAMKQGGDLGGYVS